MNAKKGVVFGYNGLTTLATTRDLRPLGFQDIAIASSVAAILKRAWRVTMRGYTPFYVERRLMILRNLMTFVEMLGEEE